MGFKLVLIMGVVMAVVGGGFYWYYQDTQAKLAILHENNAKLEISVQTQQKTIEQQTKDIQRANKLVAETNLKFAQAQKSLIKLVNYLVKEI